MEVLTDIQRLPCRRLAHQFGSSDKAMGTTAPNALHTNKPLRSDAMGMTPKDGILSFIHTGAEQAITVHLWHDSIHNADASKGWVQVAESAALSSKTVQPYGIASVKVAPNVPYFLQAGASTITDCWVNGPADDTNPNTF